MDRPRTASRVKTGTRTEIIPAVDKTQTAGIMVVFLSAQITVDPGVFGALDPLAKFDTILGRRLFTDVLGTHGGRRHRIIRRHDTAAAVRRIVTPEDAVRRIRLDRIGAHRFVLVPVQRTREDGLAEGVPHAEGIVHHALVQVRVDILDPCIDIRHFFMF